MATILEMRKRFEEMQSRTDEIIYGALKDNEQDLNDLNLEQIYSGKNNEGENLRPSYLEDPYWDDKGGLKAAQAYSDWKDRITPSPFRNPGTPNLFINGYYHSRRRTLISPGGEIIHEDSAHFGKDIKSKYKNLDGLGGRFKQIFLKEYVQPVLNESIEEVLKLKVISV